MDIIQKVIHSIRNSIGKIFTSHHKTPVRSMYNAGSAAPTNEYEHLTPLEQSIMSGFEQLNEAEKLDILIFAAQLAASNKQNTNEKVGKQGEQ